MESLSTCVRFDGFELHYHVILVGHVSENYDASDLRSFFLGCSDSPEEHLPVSSLSNGSIVGHLSAQHPMCINSAKPVVFRTLSVPSLIWGLVV